MPEMDDVHRLYFYSVDALGTWIFSFEDPQEVHYSVPYPPEPPLPGQTRRFWLMVDGVHPYLEIFMIWNGFYQG